MNRAVFQKTFELINLLMGCSPDGGFFMPYVKSFFTGGKAVTPKRKVNKSTLPNQKSRQCIRGYNLVKCKRVESVMEGLNCALTI